MSLTYPIRGFAWSLYTCAALWRVVYDASATERPPGNIGEEKGKYSLFRDPVSSQYDINC